ncbi:MAG: trimethylamine methyltransferase family protein [Candidatus Omnitrophica bacterium]|nr:trimethylamine methyltransferase family protein [Candidatus Omnitrophota bacterium]
MKNIKWHIEGGFEPHDVKQIHDLALKMIDEIGIHTPSKQAIQILSSEKGVKIKNETRVCIVPEKVEQLLGPFPRKQNTSQDSEPKFYVSGYSLRCYDFRTGEIRKPASNDLIEFTKIGHSLGVSGNATVMPLDLPQKLAEIATYKLCLDVSDRIWGAGIFSDSDVFDMVQEIQTIVGLNYSVGMHMISPMAFDPFLLDMAMRYIPKKASFSVGNMPMQGATTHINPFIAIAQSCAEVIGGASILKILSPESNISFVPFLYPFDMKYGTIVYGGPDFLLTNLALIEVAKFYGISVMAKAFNTMAKFPDDAQFGFCSAVCLATMLAGLKNFGWAGVISIDEVASVEAMIIEYEIFKAIRHIANGIYYDENIDLNEIKKCIEDGTFLTNEDTIKNCRTQFFNSDIFSNETLAIWKRNGKKSIQDRAREKAHQLLKSHNFQRDPVQQKELDKIWEKAKKLFG